MSCDMKSPYGGAKGMSQLLTGKLTIQNEKSWRLSFIVVIYHRPLSVCQDMRLASQCLYCPLSCVLRRQLLCIKLPKVGLFNNTSSIQQNLGSKVPAKRCSFFWIRPGVKLAHKGEGISRSASTVLHFFTSGY